MQIEQTGKVIAVLPEQRFIGKNGEIVKNAFVVEWQDNGYTQKLCLEVVGLDKWEKMKSSVVAGHEVLVRFSVSSREWNQRWFTSCQCFYCSAVGGQQTTTQTRAPHTHSAPQQQEDGQDVPF